MFCLCLCLLYLQNLHSSLTSRIIEERRRRLAPETVEMLSCIKDWEAGDARAQHSVEDKELEAAFDEMYLDGQNV